MRVSQLQSVNLPLQVSQLQSVSQHLQVLQHQQVSQLLQHLPQRVNQHQLLPQRQRALKLQLH
ncbi:hypothetical protein [Streptococcus oralis]|uniref:hypothetical protein n=1 Tax=Streptococcus oralis TaxID=1303 RepID=UPI0021B1290E|nr:hypothetical protein [Streptococcus oralis]